MNKKQYLSYKGVLNLIFEYANCHNIISNNPVNKIKNSVYLKSCNCKKPDSKEKILSEDEIQELIAMAKTRADKKYYPYYHAIRYSSLTGCRVGEICALRWKDIDFENQLIHISSQQLAEFKDHRTSYYLVDYTKAEKGVTNDGRFFPLTDDLMHLLTELKDTQSKEGIVSEFVFCMASGEWMNTKSYCSVFHRLCEKCGLEITNNHALRMSLNSNVMIPQGLSVADRAKLLGHSVETNLAFYSFAEKDYLEKARNILNNGANVTKEPLGNPLSTISLQKEKASELLF